MCIAAGAFPGCWCSDPEPCIEDLEIGDQVAITVIERYDETSRFPGDFEGLGPCNETIGFGPGTALRATVRRWSDFGDALCKGVTVDLAMPGQTLTLRPDEIDSYEVNGYYDALDDAGCSGRLHFGLVLVPSVERPFPAIPVPGQRPPLFMAVDYVSDADAGCPATCTTKLVVRVEKL